MGELSRATCFFIGLNELTSLSDATDLKSLVFPEVQHATCKRCHLKWSGRILFALMLDYPQPSLFQLLSGRSGTRSLLKVAVRKVYSCRDW